MKGIILALCIALALPLALAGQEIALDLATSATVSRMSAQDFTIYERASPRFILPFGTTMELAGNGYFKGAYSSGDITKPFSYGLQQLRLEVAIKKPQPGLDSMVMRLGRFAFADPSGYVLSSPADGLSLDFKYPLLEVGLRTGYTGLLFLNDSDATLISMSLADQTRIADDKKFVGSPRLIFQANLSLPDIFGQSVMLSFLTQDDLNPADSLLKEGTTTFTPGLGGRFNTQYFELQGSGTVSRVGYRAFFVYGTGRTLSWVVDPSSADTGHSYQYKPISSFMGGVHADFAVPLPIEGSAVGLGAVLASGDKDEMSFTEGNISSVYKQFTPITSPTLGAVFSPSLGNIALGEASFSASPTIGSFHFDGQFKAMAFFRPTAGPISSPGLNPSSSSPYLGTEADLSLNYGILTDVGISCVLGAFIPGSAFDTSYAGLQYYCNLTLTVNI